MPALDETGYAIIPFTVIDPRTGNSTYARGLIDTGDERAIIDPSIVQRLGLTPTGYTQVVDVSGSLVAAPTYDVALDFGSAGSLASVHVIGMEVRHLGVDALIGVNVLQYGILVYNGLLGEFQLTIGGGQPAISTQRRDVVLLLGGTMAAIGLIGLALHAYG